MHTISIPPAPFDAVDFLFYLKRLQIVELWFMTLELIVEFVFAKRLATFTSPSVFPRHFLFEYYNTATLVACGQVLPVRIELYTRYNVGCVFTSIKC